MVKLIILFFINNCNVIIKNYCNFIITTIESEDICIVERLFSSSLVAVVSLSSPRKLRVCHFKKGNEICNYSYSNTILGVKLNRAVSIFSSINQEHTVVCGLPMSTSSLLMK